MASEFPESKSDPKTRASKSNQVTSGAPQPNLFKASDESGEARPVAKKNPRGGLPLGPIFMAVAAVFVLCALWYVDRVEKESGQSKRVSTVATKSTPPKSARQPAAISYTLFVPNDNAMLSPRIVTEKNPFRTTPDWSLKAGHTLELLCKRLKALPRATKVLNSPTRDERGVVTINMSDDFMVLNVAHETTVALVLDAMASTLGKVEGGDGQTLNNGNPVKLRVLVEGRPLKTFSEYDLSEPWTSTQPEAVG